MLGTWAQFLVQLEAVFDDKMAMKKAHKAIKHFQQVLQQVEALAQEAGLGTSEVEKIRLVKRNVNAPCLLCASESLNNQ
jgi:hypothetical protein